MKEPDVFRFPCADCAVAAKSEDKPKTFTVAEFGKHFSKRHGGRKFTKFNSDSFFCFFLLANVMFDIIISISQFSV